MTLHSVQIVSSIEDESAGPSYSVVRLAEALAARGGRSVLMSLADRAGDNLSNGVLIRRFRPDLRSFPLAAKLAPSRAMAQAVETISREGAVLHVHGLWRMPNVYPGRAARRTGAPLVISPRGMLGHAAMQFSRRQKQLFWHAIQKRALQPVACFHATAASELDDIRAFGIKTPVAIIPNGVDVPDSIVAPPQRDGKHQVLHLGRIHPKKGIDRLLRAWALLHRENTSWQLRIVGPSEMGHKQQLEALASALSLTNVRFDGPLHGAAKAAAYSRADLFVLPTLHENFGMVVAEALAHGTPVISTIGAPWQGLVTERCGWWVDHGPEALAAALSEAMALTNETRTQMGLQGQAWMRRDFSWGAISGQVERLYRWCAGDGDRPEFVFE